MPTGPVHTRLLKSTFLTLQVPYILLGILGSIVQTVNLSQGVFFDPATMRPLVNNEGMRLSLQIYANLTRFNAPEAAAFCRPYDTWFYNGQAQG